VKFTQVHWLGKEFHATVVIQKFAKITILLLQCTLITHLSKIDSFEANYRTHFSSPLVKIFIAFFCTMRVEAQQWPG